MTRNSKNEYSKNEYSKNGYEKSEYSKNQKNSRDCNHVKDREMSSYGQQNREQDEKDEYEKYEVNLGIPAEKAGGGSHTDSAAGFCIHIKQERKSDPERGTRIWQA